AAGAPPADGGGAGGAQPQLQRCQAGAKRLPADCPDGGRGPGVLAGFGTPLQKGSYAHGPTPVKRVLPVSAMGPSRPGAQTERRGGAGPVRGLLGGKD